MQYTIYTDLSSLTERDLKNLSPLLSFHWKDLNLKAILAGESNPVSPFTLTGDIADCDLVVLPMHWTYYLWNQKARMTEAFDLANLARKHRKELVIWFKGDLIPQTPFDNARVFLPGMIRSRANSKQIACPVFIDDPEPVWGTRHDRVRKKSERPTVGFCGYGSLSTIKLAWSIFKGLQLKGASMVRKSDYYGSVVVPATALRNRAIRLLEEDHRIDTSFVIRDRYTDRTTSDSKLETKVKVESFYSNMYGTDYTLCVRGFGNWSYRFYETLACGRIPVFIDSDCVLPLESKIDWRRYCVWVEKSELPLIGEKLLDFHSSLCPTDFVDLQLECRKLWKTQLSLEGCIGNFQNYIEEPDTRSSRGRRLI